MSSLGPGRAQTELYVAISSTEQVTGLQRSAHGQVIISRGFGGIRMRGALS